MKYERLYDKFKEMTCAQRKQDTCDQPLLLIERAYLDGRIIMK